MAELSRFLDLIAWGSLGVLCVFTYLIARLFQRRSGISTKPLLFGLAAAVLVGTGVAEAIRCCGPFPNTTSYLLAVFGLATVAAVFHVYALMTGAAR